MARERIAPTEWSRETIYERPEVPTTTIDAVHRRETPSEALARQALRDQARGALNDAANLIQTEHAGTVTAHDTKGVVLTRRDIREIQSGNPDARK